MFFDKNVRYTLRKDYQICVNCIMDTTASEIFFDQHGICNFCAGKEFHQNRDWCVDDSSVLRIKKIYNEIRNKKMSKKYDSLIGLSGGIDSAVVAFKAIENGLKPLALHIDAGWNTNESVSNVEKICKHLNLDLHTIVIDWQEMRKLQIAYLQSGVMNQDTPQDHALFSSFYKFAKKYNFEYVLSGVNFSSEMVQPASWGYTFADGKQIKYIAKKFQKLKLKKYPLMKIRQYKKYIENNFFKVVRPLDYGIYKPLEWQDKFLKLIDWKPYKSKHGESLFTFFYQSIYLYEKFKIDKRRNYLSSLILSENIKRAEAIKLVESPILNANERNILMNSICSKLEIPIEEMNNFLNSPIVSHFDLPNDSKRI